MRTTPNLHNLTPGHDDYLHDLLNPDFDHLCRYPEYGGDSSYVETLLRDVSFISSNGLYKSGPVIPFKKRPRPKVEAAVSISTAVSSQ